MKKSEVYEIDVYKEEIETDDDGNVIYHPLYGRKPVSGREATTYGIMTFGGRNLDKASQLSGISYYCIQFFGESDQKHGREAWADPIRASILNDLCPPGYSWYISTDGNLADPHSKGKYIDFIDYIQETVFPLHHLDHCYVSSERPYGHGYGFCERCIIEIPKELIEQYVSTYWRYASPGGFPIEGYNMRSGNIMLLSKWNQRQRDPELFLEVVNQVNCMFFTFPSEHCHFEFITNKYTYEEFQNSIQLTKLKEMITNME